jgi:predicted Zn-dependent protease
MTLLLPVVAIGCAAPAAYQAGSGQVVVRSASPSLKSQGAVAFAQYKRKVPISRNATARARVFRVANRLRPIVNLPGASWEFEVFEDKSANAFALPGGKVGINTGLLKIAATDAQLAAVVAHEMAHVTSNHAESRVQRNQTISIGSAVLGAVLGGEENSRQVGQLAQQGGTLLFGLPFSRGQELEADRIGTIFMARAGYDPAAAITLWERMGVSQPSGMPEFLSTHPVSSTRIQKLREFLPQAQAQMR